MYSSPTLFTGCNCPLSPSTYNSVLPIGLPMGAATCPSSCCNACAAFSPGSSHTLQPTTVSVGPYSFTKLACGSSSSFHFFNFCAPSCSPPITIRCEAWHGVAALSTYSSASRCAGVSLNNSPWRCLWLWLWPFTFAWPWPFSLPLLPLLPLLLLLS